MPNGTSAPSADKPSKLLEFGRGIRSGGPPPDESRHVRALQPVRQRLGGSQATEPSTEAGEPVGANRNTDSVGDFGLRYRIMTGAEPVPKNVDVRKTPARLQNDSGWHLRSPATGLVGGLSPAHRGVEAFRAAIHLAPERTSQNSPMRDARAGMGSRTNAPRECALTRPGSGDVGPGNRRLAFPNARWQPVSAG